MIEPNLQERLTREAQGEALPVIETRGRHLRDVTTDTLREAKKAVRVEARIHAGEDRDVAAWREWEVSLVKGCCVLLCVCK